jgi:uncharacterized protein (DUF362 family)
MNKKETNTKLISRRKFLGYSAVVAGSVPFYSHAASKKEKITVLEKNNAYALKGFIPKISSGWFETNGYKSKEKLLRNVIEDASDFSWLKKGDSVLLKLALNSGNKYPATTDPWVLGIVIKMLQEKGAGKIIAGDKSGVEAVIRFEDKKEGASKDLCDSSGLLKVIKENHAIPDFFEEKGPDSYFKAWPESSHHWKEPIWITKTVKEVDHIIYLPRVSSHVMGDITCGLKIGVGFLRDDSRLAFHRGGKNFYQMYEEINDIPEIKRKLRMSITSGRKVFSTMGPDDGYLSSPDFGLIMASEDLVANELLSYAWLKWNREFHTPAFNKFTSGKITNFRSVINKLFLRFKFNSEDGKKTPDMPFFQAGNIFNHPAIANYFEKKGGNPEKILWNSLNKNPDMSITNYITQNLVT